MSVALHSQYPEHATVPYCSWTFPSLRFPLNLGIQERLNFKLPRIFRETFDPNFTLNKIESIQFEEETMKGIRTVTLLSFAFVLALSIPSTLFAGGNNGGTENFKTAGTWIMQSLYYGDVAIYTATSNNDASGGSFSYTIHQVGGDPTIGGLYPDAASVQPPMMGQGHKTGRDTYESNALYYVKNTNGSLAYLMIIKVKGRILDANTVMSSSLIYMYDAANVGPNGMPVANAPLVFGGPIPDLSYEQNIDVVIPPLDPPADYPSAP